MPVRNRMIHRAAVERTVVSDPFDTFGSTATDEEIYGGEAISLLWGNLGLHWDALQLTWGRAGGSLLPCYVQAQQERRIGETGKLFALTSYQMWCPLGSDLQEEDRITLVEDKRGQVVFEDSLRVTAVFRRETHLAATLEAYA